MMILAWTHPRMFKVFEIFGYIPLIVVDDANNTIGTGRPIMICRVYLPTILP